MPSLNELLVVFPNNKILLTHKNQTNESWTNGKYYLCGHILLGVNDNITNEHLVNIFQNNNSDADVCNSCEMASVYRSREEYNTFNELLCEYKTKVNLII
jgi:hypothetical protein